MSDIVTNLAPEIRGLKAQERSKGHVVAGTGDVAQNPAVAEQKDRAIAPAGGRQRDFPVAGARGPANQGAANHWGWRLQAGMEIQSYAETTAIRSVEAGAIAVCDPAIATVWRLTCAGAVTLEVPFPPITTVGGEVTSRTVSVVIYMYRLPTTVITWPAGTLFPREVLDPNSDGDRGDSLLLPPTGSRLDAFALAHVPGIGWIGTVSALGLEPV